MIEPNHHEAAKALSLALDARADYLKSHSEHVMKYSLVLADKLKIPRQERLIIVNICKLHDVGLISISDSILSKKDALTREEREEMKRHPLIGCDILSNIGFDSEELLLVKSHHERYDGNAYPEGIKEHNIPHLARIVSVADAFDAMTSDRPFRKKLSLDKAIEELRRNQGTQFDPIIVKAFVSIL